MMQSNLQSMVGRSLRNSVLLLAIFSLSIICSSSTCQQKAAISTNSVIDHVEEDQVEGTATGLEKRAKSRQVEQQKLQQQDSMKPDEKYRNVYESLIGEWRGEFVVYEDTRGQIRGRPVRVISEEYMNNLPLKETNRIQVMHRYTATDDFTVVAEIEDRWLDSKGNEVLSSYPAENNVRGDELFCIVDKPEEKVVHKGFIDDEGYIIWSRDEELPLRKEYFKEKAVGNTYSIIGYGYYGDDNPNLSPKLWFKGNYTKAD